MLLWLLDGAPLELLWFFSQHFLNEETVTDGENLGEKEPSPVPDPRYQE